VGIIVLLMLIFGRTLEALPLSEREQMIMVHSGLGTLVLLLMLIRWGWRLSHKPPTPVSTMGVWQTRLSKWTHWAFYVLLIVQPVLGVSQAMFITDYSVVAFGAIDYSAWASADLEKAQLLNVLHSLNAWVLSALIIVHIAAAFYHHYIQKDSALRRMLPFGKVEAPP
jgi:cytochrome b561